jgi:MoxR-like ATPase
MEAPQEETEKTFEEKTLAKLGEGMPRMMSELRKVVVGQDAVVASLARVLLSGSHGLITGPPGLAKTLLIRSVAQILHLDFKRIQFTPDLMPSDITGTELIEEDRQSGHRELRFVPGPIFTNVLLADEINRTPPKTQAALLEAMEEKQVTVAGQSRQLNAPFFVLATQNPIELEGTYPLPEAQLDRFMCSIQIDYLPEEDELSVVTRTTADVSAQPEPVFSGQDMLDFARLVRMVPIAEPIARYAVRLSQASRPHAPEAPDFVKQWVGWGAGTRGSQYLVLAAKARALLEGRFHVATEDIRAVAHEVLRHRILTNFRAEADEVRVDDVVEKLLGHVPLPGDGMSSR